MKIGKIKIDFPVLLAPMAGFTDYPFRVLCKRMGAGLVYSEFVSADGIIRENIRTLEMIRFSEEERPIGIQIFGNDPETMSKAASFVKNNFNPDIIDINYGCPVKKVTCKGGGAAILQDIPKMVKMTSEIVKSTKLPVTVKTRLGWDEKSKYIVEVAERLQDIGIQAISIHGRTRKQMYKGEANWELIREVKNNPRIKIPVFGNGDVTCPETAKKKKEKYNVDGIMIGRAAIGNPWIFQKIKEYLKSGKIIKEPKMKDKIEMVLNHLKWSIEWKGEKLGVLEMRRHYSNYFKDLPKIKNYRSELVQLNEYNEVLNKIKKIKEIYKNY